MGRAQRQLVNLLAERESGELGELCASLHIDLPVLFGSARRDPVDARDLNIAYAFEHGMVSDDLAVVNAFGSRYGDGLDMMALDRADPVSLYEALCKGEVLVERTPEKFALRQMFAFGQFCDTQWMRDMQLEALAR